MKKKTLLQILLLHITITITTPIANAEFYKRFYLNKM